MQTKDKQTANQQPNNKKSQSFKNFLNNKFNITQRNGTFRGEISGGIVNFLVMSYVMVVIPNILTGGTNNAAFWNAIFLATILTVIVTTFFMAVGANLPLISAPGIGLSSYFATLISSGTYNFSQTLTIALVAGVLFILLTLVGFRRKLIEGLPDVLKNAIPAGIGLFILNIGLNSSNSAILEFIMHGPTHIVNGQMAIFSAGVAIFGFLIIVYLNHKKIKGSIFIGIICATLLHFTLQLVVGYNPFIALQNASWLPPFGDLFSQTFFKFDFKGTFVGDGSNVLSAVLVAVITIFSYILVDLFDTVGTLFGATKNTELVNEKGQVTNANRAFWVDSGSTVLGAMLGVPGCTVYVESATGIKSGARTGLSSFIVVLLFISALFLSPLFLMIPASATAPALIFVGITMFGSVTEIDFNKIENLLPAIFTIVIMPLTNNIAYGIGIGIILYVFTMLVTKQAKKVKFITYLLAIMFILFLATQNIL